MRQQAKAHEDWRKTQQEENKKRIQAEQQSMNSMLGVVGQMNVFQRFAPPQTPARMPSRMRSQTPAMPYSPSPSPMPLSVYPSPSAFSQTSLPMPYPSHPAGQAQHYSLPGTSTGPFTPYQQRHHYACHTHRILQDRHSTTVFLALAQAHSHRTHRDIITHAIPIASCRTGTGLQSSWH